MLTLRVSFKCSVNWALRGWSCLQASGIVLVQSGTVRIGFMLELAYATKGGSVREVLRRDDIAVIEIDLSAYPYDVACLNPDEKERAVRFICENARREFVVTRVCLRRLLAEILGASPEGLRFSYNKYGKPEVEAPASEWEFNVSHSRNRALIAVAYGRRVGIDIENEQQPVADMESVAQRFFSPYECETIMSISDDADRHRAFFRCWTRKEALIKGVGRGLSMPLDSFSVSLAEESPSIVHSEQPALEPRCWMLMNVPASSGYSGSLAIEIPG